MTKKKKPYMHLQGSLASFRGNHVPYPHPYLLIGRAPAIFLLCIEGVNIRRRAVRPPQEPVAQWSMSNLNMDNTVWSAVGLRGQGGSCGKRRGCSSSFGWDDEKKDYPSIVGWLWRTLGTVEEIRKLLPSSFKLRCT